LVELLERAGMRKLLRRRMGRRTGHGGHHCNEEAVKAYTGTMAPPRPGKPARPRARDGAARARAAGDRARPARRRIAAKVSARHAVAGARGSRVVAIRAAISAVALAPPRANRHACWILARPPGHCG
jgi:hypothetical protein